MLVYAVLGVVSLTWLLTDPGPNGRPGVGRPVLAGERKVYFR